MRPRLSTTPHIDDTAYLRHTPRPSFRRKPESIVILLSVPLKPRRRADGSAACTARGRREGSRRFGCRPGMACQPNPSARSEPSPKARARRRGCRFLWLLSFGQAKESNWSPWMATKPHTDVSRFSRGGETKSKVKMDSGFRRNDGVLDPGFRRNDDAAGFRLSPELRKSKWIPASAGMTEAAGLRPPPELDRCIPQAHSHAAVTHRR